MKDIRKFLETHGLIRNGILRLTQTEYDAGVICDVINQFVEQLNSIDCKVCGEPFNDRETLYEHYNEKHNHG